MSDTSKQQDIADLWQVVGRMQEQLNELQLRYMHHKYYYIDAAEFLNVSLRTIYRMVEGGSLTIDGHNAVGKPFFYRQQLEQHINQQ